MPRCGRLPSKLFPSLLSSNKSFLIGCSSGVRTDQQRQRKASHLRPSRREEIGEARAGAGGKRTANDPPPTNCRIRYQSETFIANIHQHLALNPLAAHRVFTQALASVSFADRRVSIPPPIPPLPSPVHPTKLKPHAALTSSPSCPDRSPASA